MEKKLLFVDTWAWYAMSNRNDKDHQKAKELNRKFVSEGYRYVTTNFIFAESYTLIIMRGKNHHAAIKFGENLKQMIRLGAIDYLTQLPRP
jgi:predicted nucleic acid-binding protein